MFGTNSNNTTVFGAVFVIEMNGEINATVKDLNVGVRKTHKSVPVSKQRETAKAER